MSLLQRFFGKQREVVFEATNESGDVRKYRISVDDWELWFEGQRLVRIDGLDRATNLTMLNVCTVYLNLFHALIRCVQIHNNSFVDVPPCVFAMPRLVDFNVSVLCASRCR
jgi:hypothetical protein